MEFSSFGCLNVAVEGCCHGELDKIYETIINIEQIKNTKVDLLLVCGDFQCVRDIVDLENVAMPPKYRQLNSFHDYVTGKKKAPVTTIFIGGNHEASNLLHSLYYGGWVAPNIYFLGFAGVVWFGGIRISGLSGIFGNHDYKKGHYERIPYNYDQTKSIYHLRELEVYRMSHLISDIDVMLSHDWPQDIWEFGDKQQLLRIKPYFQEDINTRKLGSPPLMQLLRQLQPNFWFAAHLHVKFAALVPHNSNQTENIAYCNEISNSNKSNNTRFLALDKVIPGRYS